MPAKPIPAIQGIPSVQGIPAIQGILAGQGIKLVYSPMAFVPGLTKPIRGLRPLISIVLLVLLSRAAYRHI